MRSQLRDLLVSRSVLGAPERWDEVLEVVAAAAAAAAVAPRVDDDTDDDGPAMGSSEMSA